MRELPRSCSLCPRACHADRAAGATGACGADDSLRVARAALHFWEEPPLSGYHGSGAVFFSNCSLRCVYCQNAALSRGALGKAITVGRLADIFLELQDQGALNINLVTPSHYLPQILDALDSARGRGLALPIVYNTSGYETVETIRALDGYVDIYLTDLKYHDDVLAARYSAAPGYFDTAAAALDAMVAQVGEYRLGGIDTIVGASSADLSPSNLPPAAHSKSDPGPLYPDFDPNSLGFNPDSLDPGPSDSVSDPIDLLAGGVIVRHLLLPGHLDDAKRLVAYLAQTYGDTVCLSLMSQYTPLSTLPAGFPELDRTVSDDEYDELIDFALDQGVTNSFMQEGGCVGESFIPDFDCTGV